MRLLRSFINGKYVKEAKATTASFDLANPATNEIVTRVFACSDTELQTAIESAKQAQSIWYNEYSPLDRSKILNRTAQLLTEQNDEIAKLETLDTGRCIAETNVVDVVSAADCLTYYAGLAPALGGQTMDLVAGGNAGAASSWGYTRREPLGVTAGIGAWNYPLQSAAWKSAPALAFGNSMVFKPSEETPLTALKLAETFLEAGVPPGVFNVVLGDGPSVGASLIQSPQVKKVSFTGSLDTGRKIYQNAAEKFQKVTMELGGKSPLIIFDDADITQAVSGAMMANWYSSGQVCSNGTRVFVHESRLAEFLDQLVERTSKLNIGNPMNPEMDIGPMITKKHMNKVLRYIDRGREQGAELYYGGQKIQVAGCEDGYFLSPAIFVNCTDDMDIVQEEVFGMVMSVLSFVDETEVLERANDTPFGLSAGVFTKDIQRAHRMVAKLQAGTTWINNYNLAPIELPWGGYKWSGIGRENGWAGADAWTQVKSVYVEMNEIDCPYD